jgi:Protein of unknown function (DUF2721)
MLNPIPIDEMTRIIGLPTAPAFLLGAVAGLLSLLFGRLDHVANLHRQLPGTGKSDGPRSDHNMFATRSRARAGCIRVGIIPCGVSIILSGWTVVLVFIDALFAMQNNRAIALMFIAAITLFTIALSGGHEPP